MAHNKDYTWEELKAKSRGSSIDMSAAAVKERMEKLSSLHAFARMAEKTHNKLKDKHLED